MNSWIQQQVLNSISQLSFQSPVLTFFHPLPGTGEGGGGDTVALFRYMGFWSRKGMHY